MSKATYKKKYTPEMEADIVETRDRLRDGGHDHNKIVEAVQAMLKKKYSFEPKIQSVHMKLLRMDRLGPQGPKTVKKSVTINVQGVEITVLFRDKQ